MSEKARAFEMGPDRIGIERSVSDPKIEWEKRILCLKQSNLDCPPKCPSYELAVALKEAVLTGNSGVIEQVKQKIADTKALEECINNIPPSGLLRFSNTLS